MAKIDPNAIVQVVNISDDMLKFKTPFAMSVSGASMSGKSEFILKLIEHRDVLFDVKFEHIFYCEPEALVLRHNPIYERLRDAFPNAQLVVGLPDVKSLNLTLDCTPKLILIDDLMGPFLQSEEMVKLLSIECHHFNITTIFTLQNFFAPSKFGKTLHRNTTYRCLFYNRLDLTEIRTISMQICHQPKFLLESFEFLHQKFPSEPPYIIIDGHGRSELKELFVRSHIFPDPDSKKIKPIFFFPN